MCHEPAKLLFKGNNVVQERWLGGLYLSGLEEDLS